MRDIKFRAWNSRYKQMKLVERIFFNEHKIQISHGFTGMDTSEWFLDHCELMQYTGLTDKNEKQIYEGDIVLVDWGDGELNARVYWDSSTLIYMIQFSGNGDTDFLFECNEISQIIGNIYENLELLNDTNPQP